MEVIKIYHQIKKTSAGFAIPIKLSQNMKIALAMFAVYAQHLCQKNASNWNRTIFLGTFKQGSSCGGQLTLLVVGVKLDKNTQFFSSNFCVT